MFFMETQLHDISWFCLTHHGRQSSNRCSELLKHEHTACHKNSLSLCFLSLPLRHPPNPQLLAHDLVWFFSWPLSKRLRRLRLHLMKHLVFTSLRAPQSHSSNIVLIKQFLIFYLFFLTGRRELSGKLRVEARMSSWETELCVMFTAIICSLLAQQRAGISFQTWVCSIQTRQPPLKCSWFAFVDTSSVSVGADKRLSRLLSTFSAATRGSALLICCFATHLHSWDTLLKELPASHSLLQTSSFCDVVFMVFSTLVTQAAVEHSWSLLCWGGKHICDSTGAWDTQPCSAAPQLVAVPLQASDYNPSSGMSSSIPQCCKCRRNRLCGREAEAGAGRVDLLLLSASKCSSTSAPLEKHQSLLTAWQKTALLGIAPSIMSHPSAVLPATWILGASLVSALCDQLTP